MANLITSKLVKYCAAASLSAALLSAPVFAQTSSEEWQDLESLLPPSASSLAPDDGWRDLDDYETSTTQAPTTPSDATPNDGWQDISTFTSSDEVRPSSNIESSDISGSEWINIEDDLAEVTQDMALPVSGLNAGDLVDISVSNDESLGGAYRISSIGTLVLPLIGSVDVAGLTALDLETKLEQLYGADYLVDPVVTVATREKIIGQVSIDGLINRAGPLSLTAGDTLSSMLAKASGVRGDKAALDAVILRNQSDKISARRVSLSGIGLNGDRGPILLPDDQITIIRREALPEIDSTGGKYPLLDNVLNGGYIKNL